MTDYVINAAMINTVRGEVLAHTRYMSAKDEAVALLMKHDITPKDLVPPKGKTLQDNLHVVKYYFALGLAVNAVKLKGQYITTEGFERFMNPELSAAAMIDGKPKAGLGPDGKGNTWGHLAGSALKRWKDALAEAIEAAKTGEATQTTRTVKTTEEFLMDLLQKAYVRTQKADCGKVHDLDGFKKALHEAAFAITGKDGQIKTGDKTKK